ncbi:glutamate cyclase domain-containing protein [Micromonospora chokoriensis]|uniref:glutamate cyclase domain-containing protein n=1 Tax=Micromonospora chokoriensis TaxID=356851 RepID=UPI0004C2C540|nr:glutamate cyclase domain-containing protein [Micromonospora chokoriensis]
MRIDETIAELEHVAAREVGRGSEALAEPAAGGLLAAARSLATAAAPDAAVFTGFFIPGADPPAVETDGPLGAVQIAAALRLLGGRCRLVTDEPCAPVIEAAVAAAAPGLSVDVAPLRGYDDWAAAHLPEYARLTHLIACERAGPTVDGRPRNMRGEDISAHTAPLDRLYTCGSAFRIGIGDGGNELGMGLLPADLIGRVVASGERIRCVVGADALLVGGTSNWAAAALVGALSLLRPEVPELRTLLEPAWSYDLLTAIVRAGAVDGVRRRRALSVDGLDWPAYAEPLTRIAELVRAGR